MFLDYLILAQKALYESLTVQHISWVYIQNSVLYDLKLSPLLQTEESHTTCIQTNKVLNLLAYNKTQHTYQLVHTDAKSNDLHLKALFDIKKSRPSQSPEEDYKTLSRWLNSVFKNFSIKMNLF